MLLDTLKLLSFEGMDVKINKCNDHICITNSKTEQVIENGKMGLKLPLSIQKLSMMVKL